MKDWASLCEISEEKVRYLLFMLPPGLCYVGCAHMAGQKYLIKVFILGVVEETARGFARLSSLRVSVFFFIFSCSFLAPAFNNFATISGYLSLNRPCDYCCVFWGEACSRTSNSCWFSHHDDGHKQRFYCSTALEFFGRGTLCRQVWNFDLKNNCVFWWLCICADWCWSW